ncbi:19659_t:CDS:2, partial [Gigaspora rosea]
SFELYEIILEIGELDDHYASDIVESVNFVFDKFNINHQKIFSITTDNGVNVKTKTSRRANFKVQNTRFNFVKRKKRKQLYKAQLQVIPGLKEPLNVIKDMDTRWKSTFHLIEQLAHLRPAIMLLYSTLNNHTLREVRKSAETLSSFLLSEEEFELLKELVVILSPFDEAT